MKHILEWLEVAWAVTIFLTTLSLFVLIPLAEQPWFHRAKLWAGRGLRISALSFLVTLMLPLPVMCVLDHVPIATSMLFIGGFGRSASARPF